MNTTADILVVDDSLVSLRLATDVLRRDGYTVRPANSGELALASAFASPPDLVLLDICMPGIDGYEVCRRLKGRAATRHVPVIFLSGATDVERRVEGFDVGAVDYITKPFLNDELCARVRAHVRIALQHRRRTELIDLARLRLLEYVDTHSVDELLQLTLDEAETLTGSRIGFFHFVEDDQESLHLQNWSSRTKAEFCNAKGKGDHYPVSSAGVWADCVRQARPVIHNDYASLAHKRGMPEGHAAVTRELTVPVVRNGRVRAVLGVGNKPEEYDTPDVQAVSALAELAWEIVERRRAEEALQEVNATLERRVDERTKELEHLHAQLVQAQKLEAIGSLAAGIAHEINTPAQYVSDNLTFLRRASHLLGELARRAETCLSCEDESAKQALHEAVKRARLDYTLMQIPEALAQSVEGMDRIRSIVGALKDFSHPSGADKTPVDLALAISTTVLVARNEWKYDCEIITDFEPDMPPVPALRDQLNQVLLNLIVNAAHTIGDARRAEGEGARKGTITVRTRTEDGWVAVEVTDTGMGIPAEIRGRIFDPFFTTKPVGKGSGQGLAIAYNVVVERHGGRIELDSEVGKGSTFRVSLPLGHGEALNGVGEPG